jgi:hypothetical protein
MDYGRHSQVNRQVCGVSLSDHYRVAAACQGYHDGTAGIEGMP